MDLTPRIPAGRQVIERYAASGFRISGIVHRGSVLVFPDRTIPWPVESAASLSAESLSAVVEHGDMEILLIGWGRDGRPVPPELRAALRAAGIVVEAMATGAACRTFNVLVGEDRRVVAALLPPA